MDQSNSRKKPGLLSIYNSSTRKVNILPFAATWMDLEHIMLSDISEKEKEKYHMMSLICGI